MAGFWTMPTTFSSLSGNQPASLLDSNFQYLAITPMYATAMGGTGNAMTMTVPATFGGYSTGMVFVGTPSVSSVGGGLTLNVNSQGAKTVVKEVSTAIASNDITSQAPAMFYYDGTNFHLINPLISSSFASPGPIGSTTPSTITGTIIRATGAFQETAVALGSGSGTVTVNLQSGNYFTQTITGITTINVSNTPTSLTVGSFVLDLTNGGSSTVTWGFSPKWSGGVAPTLTASGRDVLSFFTLNGGTTWNGFVFGKAMA